MAPPQNIFSSTLYTLIFKNLSKDGFTAAECFWAPLKRFWVMVLWRDLSDQQNSLDQQFTGAKAVFLLFLRVLQSSYGFLKDGLDLGKMNEGVLKHLQGLLLEKRKWPEQQSYQAKNRVVLLTVAQMKKLVTEGSDWVKSKGEAVTAELQFFVCASVECICPCRDIFGSCTWSSCVLLR